jgi:hypothetical protein
MSIADDLCLEMLAADACALRAELVVYREMVHIATQALHDAEARQLGLTAQLAAMKDEVRRVTRAACAP